MIEDSDGEKEKECVQSPVKKKKVTHDTCAKGVKGVRGIAEKLNISPPRRFFAATMTNIDSDDGFQFGGNEK